MDLFGFPFAICQTGCFSGEAGLVFALQELCCLVNPHHSPFPIAGAEGWHQNAPGSCCCFSPLRCKVGRWTIHEALGLFVACCTLVLGFGRENHIKRFVGLFLLKNLNIFIVEK